ncbi:DUF2505 domain-containing protein [Saccharopolyspora rectivirgula]|uniref:DUF2505 domain-containing protein n=1 Tax=Saccharopolyspora rectivirgula TaxID=28042 RepID=A0A073BC32_9PSEU|nr:DUF2505 domain-containing protein [Saccharopolyspora rectivirgula]KEI45329.1 hypothetical protein GU90_06015 [Saccharopolyspora rectivirgula]
MTRRIEHRSTSGWPAAAVHEALVDVDYLTERLHALGGSRAELVQHETTDDGVHYQLRHGIRSESLPALARSVVAGDLVVDRSESWRQADENHYTGEVAAEIAGAPCSITGSMWLRDLTTPTDSSTSELVFSAKVDVNLPFVGGKLEELVANQVEQLLLAEERFTEEWLAARK